MSIETTARDFFDACDTGRGWEACRPFCHEDAGFSCQADALAGIDTLAGYADWMQGLLGPVPDGHFALTAVATDEDRATVVVAAVFHGTHSGAGGPVPASGRAVASDYVYLIGFDGPKIRHMTKVWNDVQALRALGWA